MHGVHEQLIQCVSFVHLWVKVEKAQATRFCILQRASGGQVRKILICLLCETLKFQQFEVQSQMHSNLCILANAMHHDDEDHAPDELEDTETQVAAPADAVAPSCHRCNDDLGGDGGCASCTAAGYAPARGHGFALSSERQRPPAEPRLPHDGHREDQRFHMEGLEEIDD